MKCEYAMHVSVRGEQEPEIKEFTSCCEWCPPSPVPTGPPGRALRSTLAKSHRFLSHRSGQGPPQNGGRSATGVRTVWRGPGEDHSPTRSDKLAEPF